ncbi:MAG TPA: hypothetical protein PKB13_01065, partial [Clostridia bacterium]|nr:hypothetical protein [Clostridia bacterium]
DMTEYDAIRGFNRYLQASSDLIYYTPVIQRFRQLEKYVRENSEGTTKNTALAAFLHDYTNQLANKKPDLDRALEGVAGREIYTVTDKITGAIGAASVAGNFSVGFSNLISFFTSVPGLQADKIAPAIRDTVRQGLTNPKDDFIDKIPELTRRLGKNEEILVSKLDKAKQKGSKLLGIWFDITDRFSVITVARAKYAEMKEKGLSETEAVQRTNDFLVKMFASRSKGMTPKLFTSKALKPILQFQLEAWNQLSHFRDMYRYDIAEQVDEIIARNNGRADGIDWAALENQVKNITPRGLWKKFMYLLLLSVWGAFTRALLGRDQTWNPAGMVADIATSEKPVIAAWETLTDQAPLLSVFTGGRVPLAGGVENITQPIGQLADPDADKGDAVLDLMKGVIGLVPGGGQAKKTWQGVKAYSEGGYYTDTGRLKYPVDQDVLQNPSERPFLSCAKGIRLAGRYPFTLAHRKVQKNGGARHR